MSQAEHHRSDHMKAGAAPSDAEVLLLNDDRPMRLCGMFETPALANQNCD